MSVFELFPGRACVSPAEAGEAVFGWAPATTHNRVFSGKFPLPLVVVGGKKLVRLVDIAAAIGEVVPAPTSAPATPSSRRPGRPRKMGVQS